MPTILKNFTADVTTKADDDTSGGFSAVVAVFGNVDSQGDVIDKGAFSDTLNDWTLKGQPIPIIWSHDWDDPFSHIGGVDPAKAEQTDEGLLINGQLDLDNPTGAQVYKLMKSGRVAQFSFAATTADGGWTLTEDSTTGAIVQHLTKLDLIEVGPTLRGANQETHLVAIKSDSPTLKSDPPSRPQNPAPEPDEVVEKTAGPIYVDVIPRFNSVEIAAALTAEVSKASELIEKQGRVLAQKHVDTLRGVHKTLGDLIDAVSKTPSPDDEEDEAKSAPGPVTPEDAAAKTKARLMELTPRKGAHS